MKQKIGFSMVFLIIVGLYQTVAASERIVIAGTGDSQVLLRKLSALYEKMHPMARIEIPDSVGSGGGIKAVINGTADLGRTARPLKEKEKVGNLVEIPFSISVSNHVLSGQAAPSDPACP